MKVKPVVADDEVLRSAGGVKGHCRGNDKIEIMAAIAINS